MAVSRKVKAATAAICTFLIKCVIRTVHEYTAQKSGFNYPLQKDRKGNYKIQSGEMIRVCMTSDFFLEQADEWWHEAWNIVRLWSDYRR